MPVLKVGRLAPWSRLALAGILLVSGFLHLFRLNQVGINGFGNPYYAAGVQSMLTGWRAFFYLAFDPAGFLALDKAPLALWIQAATARLFGFQGLSLLLPQAVAGILAVYVLYRLVRRAYGPPAGLLSALALAMMPASVVASRSNLPDSLLVLSLLLAAWAVTLAVERGSLGWLLAGAALVGVAFNIKMLQVLLVVPALAALYLFGSALPWRRRLVQAGLALLVAVVISAAWVLAVGLTHPSQRPYVGGSTTNSMVELVFWYNGAARLWAQDFSYFLGPPSPLRLFNEKLAGQASWLLPFGLIGLVVAAWQVRRNPEPALQVSRRRQALILWSTWLFVPLVYFSISLFYHRYYLSTMAPAIAALVGIGASALWAAWRGGGRGRWSVIAALLACAAVQALILDAHPDWGWWLIPMVLVLCLAASAALVLPLYLGPALLRRYARAAFACGILALFIAPTVWTLIPVLTCTNMTLPIGGPQFETCKPFETRPFLDPDLVTYLERHRAGARFLAATYDLGIAELGILETGEPFMALGGYRGSDPILTVDEFARLVAEGQVRFFLSMEDGGEEWPQQGAIRTWVGEHCPPSQFQSQGIQVHGPCVADG